ncbi:hypothetical protein Tco_1541885 [Tanacetum coccineum]
MVPRTKHYSSSSRFNRVSKPKGKQKLRVQKGNSRVQAYYGRVKRQVKLFIGQVKQGITRGLEIAQGMGIFTLESLLEKAQGVTIMDCHAGNPCMYICDPRVENYSPMIESLYDRDG